MLAGLMSCTSLEHKTSGTENSSDGAQDRNPAASRQTFDNIKNDYMKSVLVLGSSENTDGQARETEITQIISHAANHMQFCYEKNLTDPPPPSATHVFYFTVKADGSFGDISSESTEANALNKNFHVCMYRFIGGLRASPATRSFAFRFKAQTGAK